MVNCSPCSHLLLLNPLHFPVLSHHSLDVVQDSRLSTPSPNSRPHSRSSGTSIHSISSRCPIHGRSRQKDLAPLTKQHHVLSSALPAEVAETNTENTPPPVYYNLKKDERELDALKAEAANIDAEIAKLEAEARLEVP